MEDTGYDFDKILIYIDKIADEERFFKETEDVFKHIDRLGGVYECVQKEYSKATAIEYIKKELASGMMKYMHSETAAMTF